MKQLEKRLAESEKQIKLQKQFLYNQQAAENFDTKIAEYNRQRAELEKEISKAADDKKTELQQKQAELENAATALQNKKAELEKEQSEIEKVKQQAFQQIEAEKRKMCEFSAKLDEQQKEIDRQRENGAGEKRRFWEYRRKPLQFFIF